MNDDHLSERQIHILRQSGTEAPGTGALLHEKGTGMFTCAGCGSELFASDTKYESGSGWPSFDTALPGSVTEKIDSTMGMERIEVVCAKCGGHLGHKFNDGPRDTTGQRFCINSLSLDFLDAKGNKKSGDTGQILSENK